MQTEFSSRDSVITEPGESSVFQTRKSVKLPGRNKCADVCAADSLFLSNNF